MRKRLLCPILPKPNNPVLLAESEARHAIRVLRLKPGDIVHALDGKGNQALARLSIEDHGARLEFVDSEEATEFSSHSSKSQIIPLTLEIAVLKGDAMEWVVEKATELGIHKLVPVLTDFTIVQTQAKGSQFFKERWQKIADQALKQCGRLERLDIQLPTSFQYLVSERESKEVVRLWCNEAGRLGSKDVVSALQETPIATYSEWKILIGPEGGWSEKEKQILSQRASQNPSSLVEVSLGPLVLRAETAAIYSMSVLSGFMRQVKPV